MQGDVSQFTFRSLVKPLTHLKAVLWLFVIGVVVYGNSLANGFVGDDYAQLVNNTSVHSLTNFFLFFTGGTFISSTGNPFEGIYYRPLLSIVFSMLYSVFGPWAPVYHILQLLLHITNSILLFFLFQKFIKKEIAFIISVLFLIHPFNNQSVVYISAMQEPLFLFFGLLAFSITLQKGQSFYKSLSIVLLLLCSLLSKETGIVFLIIIQLYQYLFHHKWRRELVQNICVLSTYLYLRFFVAHIFIYQKNADIPFRDADFLEKLLNLPAIIFFYLKTFFYPYDLIFNQRWVIKQIDFTSFYMPLIVTSIFFIALIYIGYIINLEKRLHLKKYIFFVIWFVIGISLNLQFIPLDFTVSDRWFYFPIVGLLGITGLIISLFKFDNKLIFSTGIILLFIVITFFSIRDIVRNTNWKNNMTLYQHDLTYNMNDYRFLLMYATEMTNKGNHTQAFTHIRRSIELRPGADNWTILALIQTRLKSKEEAKESLNKALEYDEKYYASHYLLAQIMVAYEDPEASIPVLRHAMSYYPNDIKLLQLLAIEEYNQGNKEKALQAITKALKLSPSAKSNYIYDHIINNLPINANIEY